MTLIGVASIIAELVDHRQIGRIGDDDHERLTLAPVRHEAVAQHQLRRNRPEQIVVDAEMRQVEERQPIPLREVPRLRDFRRLLGGALLRDDRFRVELGRAAAPISDWNLHIHGYL